MIKMYLTNDCRERKDHSAEISGSCSKSSKAKNGNNKRSNSNNSNSVTGLVSKYYRNLNTQHSPMTNSKNKSKILKEKTR